jgi:tubulin polyglutamylase TTLL6/13
MRMNICIHLHMFVCTDAAQGIERVVRKAKTFQRVNHIPGMVNIYRKNHLARCITKMQKIFGDVYDFFPATWILPHEVEEMTQYLAGAGRCVIIKPAGGAQGRGIYLALSASGVAVKEDSIAQAYISKPLLIDSLKFDLRVYALVTCVDPLRILVFQVHMYIYVYLNTYIYIYLRLFTW